MATDNTHVPQTEDMGNTMTEEFTSEVVQVAQADGGAQPAPANGQGANGQGANGQAPAIAGVPNGEVHVEVPSGQTVVRVQVAPGETIDLPFGGELAARFGQQGNLAIKVGDQTIILLGYAEANQQEGVTLKNAKGETVDVASVVAQTDPNLDIQTAAGPAAGPAGGQGGHLFFSFNGGNGLGGFGELGVIDPTELQYQLIQPDEKILVVGEAPELVSVTFDANGGVVNEDDLQHSHYTHSGGNDGSEVALVFVSGENPASPGLQDQLDTFFGNYSFHSRTGNDPYDTTDHEDGSQVPGFPDDNGAPDHIDQDREPLSTTAHVAVNFHNFAGGTLTFDHNGDTPIIDKLVSENLTSHGHELSYVLLPGDATHGESIVAYYTTGEGEGACTTVVFSLEIQQPSGGPQSAFDVTFTIYGPIDNTGPDFQDIFKLDATFFMNANGGSTTESPANALVFQDVDDVPELGHFEYSWQSTGGEETSGASGYVAVHYDPANLTIGIDETHGVQHTSYDRNTGSGDIDPTHALHQDVSQQTDDVCMSQDQANSYLHDVVTHAAGNPSSDASDNVNSVLSNINPSYFINGDPASGINTFLGVAQSCLNVSFGADGKAEGSTDGTQDKQAGQTLFDHDGNATATAFELYMQDGKTATGAPDGTAANAPVDSHLTNVWIDVDNGDGTFTREQVTAYQLDANTIIGIAFGEKGSEGGGDVPQLTAADLQEGGNGIPVFMLHLDPQSGELTLVQYHSVENADGSNPNDPTQILTDDGQQLIHFRATDYDGDHVDAPLEVAIIDDAPVICKITYDCGNNSVDEDFLNSSTNGIPGNHDHDTNPDNLNNPYGDGNNGDGPGHTHVSGQVQASGVDTPFSYGFHVEGLSTGTPLNSFTDDAGHVVKTAAGNDVSLSLTHVGNDWVITGTDSVLGNTVFTVTLDSVTGHFDFDLQGALQHPDNGGGDITRYEDNLLLDFGVKVTDADGDAVVSQTGGQTIQISVDDDAPTIVCQPVIDCTISSDPNREGEGNCLSESTYNVTIDINNVPGWVSITATDDQGQGTPNANVGTSTGAGFGVDSDTDGGSGGRFNEINYDNNGGVGGTGGSESLTFNFGKLVESGTVELARFYSGENGVGDEQGHWAAYKGGVLVAEGDFTASSATGQFGLTIPTVAGGFDQLVFTAAPGTHVVGTSGDESDYLVQELNLNLLPLDKQTGHFDYKFGADNGILPSGNASSEAGLGFQAHYTGGALSSDGHAVTVTESVVNGHILVQGVDSVTHLTVFTLDVNPGTPDSHGTSTATYTYTQYGPLDNNPGGSNLPFEFVIRDRDGDAVSTDISVCLKDATPTTGVTSADVYEEGLQQSQHQAHDGTDAGDGKTSVSGFLNFSYNGDGPGHITDVESTNGDNATVTHANGTWTVTTDHYVLTVDDTTGHYTFTLTEAYANQDTATDSFDNLLGHTGDLSGADLLTALGFTYTVTDADGSTANGNFTVQVHDDGPVVSACWFSDNGTVLETHDANAKGLFNPDVSTADFGALFNTHVNFGADGPGNAQIAYQLTLLQQPGQNGAVDSGLSSHGHEIYLVNFLGSIVGTTDPTHINPFAVVFTLSVDGTSGVVTLTQEQEIDHPLPGSASNYDGQTISLADGLVGLTGTVTATDSDGDTASTSKTLDLGGNVQFADDGPCLQVSASHWGVTIDETPGSQFGTNDHLFGSNPFAGSVAGTPIEWGTSILPLVDVHVDFGADGKAATNPLVFALQVTNANAGISDTATGEPIVLSQQPDGTVIGTVSGGPADGQVAFAIKVNGDGTVTVAEYRALHHDNPNDGNDSIHLASGSLSIVVTATDFDGDTATKSADIGQQITFKDDAPTAQAHNTEVRITIDESAGQQANDQPGQPGNPPFHYGTALAWGVTSGSVISTSGSSFGTDGAAASHAMVISLSIPHSGVDSGINDVATGQNIYLYQDGDNIVGRVGSNGHADANGAIAFALTIDSSGDVTVAEYRALQHPNGSDPNDTVSISNGSLQAVVTLTDGDGDQSSDSVNIGNKISFKDDAPTVTLNQDAHVTIQVDETPGPQVGDSTPAGALSQNSKDVSSLFTVNIGVDQPGTIVYSLTNNGSAFGTTSGHGTASGLYDTATHQQIYLFQNGSTVEGHVGNSVGSPVCFTVSISGSTVTLTEYRPIQHPDGGNANDSVSLNGVVDVTVTATDKDGDHVTVTAPAGLNLTFYDDGPSLQASSNQTQVTIDETPGAQAGTDDHTSGTNPFAGSVIGTPIEWGTSNGSLVNVTPTFGADGPAASNSLTYALGVTNATSGLNDTATGQPIALVQQGDGTVVGKVVGGVADGQVAFAIKVNGDGSVTVAEYRPIQHPNSGDANDSVHLNGGSLSIVVTAKDGDGDTTSQSVDVGSKINFKDDGPTGIGAVSMTVDEDKLDAAHGHLGSPGIEGGPNDIDAGTGTVGTSSTASLAGINFGADGKGDVKIDTATLPALTSDGHNVQYSLSPDGHTLTGFIQYYSADNQISETVNILTLQIDPVGLTTTFTLLGPIDHPNPGYGSNANVDTEDSSNLSFNYVATDGDGDKVGGAINVTVNDDSPTACCVSGHLTEVGSNPGQQTVAYELDYSNYNGSTGNDHVLISAAFVDGAGNLVSSLNNDTPTINHNPDSGGVYHIDGFGVSSVVDGGNGGRFDEVNYLGDGSGSTLHLSEAMVLKLADTGKVAVSATVDISEFYANEGGVGDERGAYMLYRNGVPVSGWVTFEANSSNGHETLNITGPAGGFDQIVLAGAQGSANPNGDAGSDSSDFSVHQVTFNVIDTPHVASVSGDLCLAFGADGPGGVFLNNTGPTDLTYNGHAITNEIDNGILVGKTSDGTVVYSLDIYHDQSGYHYQFDQALPVDQLAANDGQDVSKSLDFSYGVRDNDGDTTSACITVTLSNHGITVTEPPLGSGSDTVKEQGLSGGSHHGDGSNICSGAIQVNAPDGVTSIAINGVLIDLNHPQNTSIDTPDGTLSFTGWNSATGELDYTYVLKHNTHGDNTSDTFSVVVTDSQGDHNPSSSLVISIVDDTPTATNDPFSTVTAQVAAGQMIGNVLTNDVPGADGYGNPKIVSVDGATAEGSGFKLDTGDGILHIAADGSVTFDSKSGDNYGAGKTLNFTYTIADSDGDTSSATATVTVKNPALPTAPTAQDEVVNESQLASGNKLGGGSVTDSHTFTLPSGFTLAAGELGAHTLPNGTLTISQSGNVVTYSYTLTSAFDDGTTGTSDGQNTVNNANSYTVHLDGPFGQSLTVPIHVDIKDDVPVAHADHFGNFNVQIAAGEAIGNILINDSFGADGAASQKITAVSIGGTNGTSDGSGGYNVTVADGTVHVSSTGAVTFDSASGHSYGSGETFTLNYTIADKDGDTSSTTADFTIKGSIPTAAPDTASVNEGGGTYNVMLVVDVSGSMGDDSGVNGLTRLQLEQQALGQLLQSFNMPGVSLNVQIISFSDGATSSSIYSGSGAISNATSYINGLTTQSTTNYDSAITAAQSSTLFNTNGTGTNLVYFLSDGEPNEPSGSVGINPTEQAAWDAFLASHNATSEAVGVGSGINANAQTELGHVDSDGNITIVTDASTLATSLTTLLPHTVSGNVTTNDTIGADGWAAIKVSDLVVDGNHYSAASAVGGAVLAKTADTLTIQTSLGGLFIFNFDTGAWTYNPPAVNADKTESIGYTIKDSNGDTASSVLTINVKNVPNASISDASVTEPTSGTTTVTFHVTLDAAAGAGGLDLNWATADGTATAGLDYLAASGTLHFNAGETSKDITVTVNSDLLIESNETFFVNLTNPVNGNIVDNQATGTIKDSAHESLSVSSSLPDAYSATTGNDKFIGDYHLSNGIKYYDTSTVDQHNNDFTHHYIDRTGNHDDKLQAGDAGDILVGDKGHDTFVGGSGNDSFVVDHDDFFSSSDDSAVRSGNIVNGNGGTDKIEFDFNFDTTKLNNSGTTTLSHLDVLDMNNGSNETLTLNYSSVNAMADNHQLIVQANVGDSVALKNEGANVWTSTGTAIGTDGHNYVHYTAGTGVNTVNVYIDEHATVNVS